MRKGVFYCKERGYIRIMRTFDDMSRLSYKVKVLLCDNILKDYAYTFSYGEIIEREKLGFEFVEIK